MFDTSKIPESHKKRMKWENEIAITEQEGRVKIPVIELFDVDGDKIIFELLDTIEFNGQNHMILTPYCESEFEYGTGSADVFIMKEVIEPSGESLLEPIEDTAVLDAVYGLFKTAHQDEFTFK